MTKAHDNGICPNCGRADAVKEHGTREQYSREDNQRFECGGCDARWVGVRRSRRAFTVHHHRVLNGSR